MAFWARVYVNIVYLHQSVRHYLNNFIDSGWRITAPSNNLKKYVDVFLFKYFNSLLIRIGLWPRHNIQRNSVNWDGRASSRNTQHIQFLLSKFFMYLKNFVVELWFSSLSKLYSRFQLFISDSIKNEFFWKSSKILRDFRRQFIVPIN